MFEALMPALFVPRGGVRYRPAEALRDLAGLEAIPDVFGRWGPGQRVGGGDRCVGDAADNLPGTC